MSWVLVLYLVLGVAGSYAQQIQYKGKVLSQLSSHDAWAIKGRGWDLPYKDGGWDIPMQGGGWNTPKPAASTTTIKGGGWNIPMQGGGWDIPIKGEVWNTPKPAASTTTMKGGGWDIPMQGGGWNTPKPAASTTTIKIVELTSKEPQMPQLHHPVVISTIQHLTPDINRSVAKANQMCKEYAKHQYQKESIGQLFPDAEPVIRAFCGRTSKPLVFGGEDANAYEFPHMAMIGYGDEGNIAWHCGGSLISERFILSAAHCSLVLQQTPKWAKLGDTDLTNDRDVPADAVLTVKIAEIINHPDYKRNVSWYNDIALYKLEKNLELGIYVRPACLNTQPRLPDNKVVICGFGLVKSPPLQFSIPDGAVDDSLPNVLQKAELDVIPLKECNNIFKTLPANDRKFIPNGIKERMVCAGGRAQKAACNGDSGGPLQSLAPECMYDIVGVTSFGYGCKSDVPGVYSNVVDYLPWIVSKVWGDN